ncbi:MAG: M28 family peptidase [Peptococcaceae bacterium]|nr:M28 family peptidase [Peptococcaceae bacterium]
MKKKLSPEAAALQEKSWLALFPFLDISYSYQLAKRMEEFKTNPKLGYRTAGSQAEFQTGEMLAAEMKALGLEVTKEEFQLDGWDFHHARLSWQEEDGQWREAELGGYQTEFDTCGKGQYELINAGRGTAEELAQLDLQGKLALVFIDQRGDWWITYPAYACYLHGAAAVLAVQTSGYGEVNARALNAQDICGPKEAAAFSMSKKDAKRLVKAKGLTFGRSCTVEFDAKSTIMPDTKSYNIVGKIPGRDPEAMILVSAHYDSYFEGFQDDNTAVGLMLGMARALRLCGYQPRKTLVFCAMAAEEWGVIDSRYDWSVGAYNQMFRIRPQWQGKIVANINLELPAHAHGKKHKIRSVYELKRFLQQHILLLPEDMARLYPKGSGVVCPVATWSDDFSLAIAGVPSLVNEFGSGSFMETRYHSQYDNDGAYDPDIYYFHHLLYSRLLLAFDHTALPPLDFTQRLTALNESLTNQWLPPHVEGAFRSTLAAALDLAHQLTKTAENINAQYALLLLQDPVAAEGLEQESRPLFARLMKIFRFCQDSFVRLDWQENALFPHEPVQANLHWLHQAAWQLAAGDVDAALASLCRIDDNIYVRSFDRQVTEYFAHRALNQPAQRLMWGAGRLGPRLFLGDFLDYLKLRRNLGVKDFSHEILRLRTMEKEQQKILEQVIREETAALAQLARMLKKSLSKDKKKGRNKKKKDKKTNHVQAKTENLSEEEN